MCLNHEWIQTDPFSMQARLSDVSVIEVYLRFNQSLNNKVLVFCPNLGKYGFLD
jgi:hypothetical protein